MAYVTFTIQLVMHPKYSDRMANSAHPWSGCSFSRLKFNVVHCDLKIEWLGTTVLHHHYTLEVDKLMVQDLSINCLFTFTHCGWLGRAMSLGSFQCRCVLLLWHMVGQGPAVLAAGAGQVGCFFFLFFFSSCLSYLPFLMPYLLGDGWTWNFVVSAFITQQ